VTAEQETRLRPLSIADLFNVPNLIYAVLDSPMFHARISVGVLSEDRKTVRTRKGPIVVDRADAEPGQKVVVHEIP
jgi:hypothetical protein